MSRKAMNKIGGLALLAAVPFLLGAVDRTGFSSTQFETRILAAQNRERSSLSLPPLQWNASLASSANRWAQHLSATGTFEHAPDNLAEPQGENLWAGTRGRYSLEEMVDGWVREKRYFRHGTFPHNSTTGRVEDVGHYTQIVWRDTGQVGCAMATSAREDVLVCRYSEAGNFVGEMPY